MDQRQPADFTSSLFDQVSAALSPAGLEATSVYEIAVRREESFCTKIDRAREALNAYLTERTDQNLRTLRNAIASLAIAAEVSRMTRKVTTDD